MSPDTTSGTAPSCRTVVSKKSAEKSFKRNLAPPNCSLVSFLRYAHRISVVYLKSRYLMMTSLGCLAADVVSVPLVPVSLPI